MNESPEERQELERNLQDAAALADTCNHGTSVNLQPWQRGLSPETANATAYTGSSTSDVTSYSPGLLRSPRDKLFLGPSTTTPRPLFSLRKMSSEVYYSAVDQITWQDGKPDGRSYLISVLVLSVDTNGLLLLHDLPFLNTEPSIRVPR